MPDIVYSCVNSFEYLTKVYLILVHYLASLIAIRLEMIEIILFFWEQRRGVDGIPIYIHQDKFHIEFNSLSLKLSLIKN